MATDHRTLPVRDTSDPQGERGGFPSSPALEEGAAKRNHRAACDAEGRRQARAGDASEGEQTLLETMGFPPTQEVAQELIRSAAHGCGDFVCFSEKRSEASHTQ